MVKGQGNDTVVVTVVHARKCLFSRSLIVYWLALLLSERKATSKEATDGLASLLLPLRLQSGLRWAIQWSFQDLTQVRSQRSNCDIAMDQDNDTSYGSSSSWMDNETTTEASTVGQDDDGPTIKDYDSYLNPFWTVLFSGSIITGTLGNLIVLWIVIGKLKITGVNIGVQSKRASCGDEGYL